MRDFRQSFTAALVSDNAYVNPGIYLDLSSVRAANDTEDASRLLSVLS
jgi:hypothetical protein